MFAIANRVYHGKPEIPYISYYPTVVGTPALPPIPSGANNFLGMFGGWVKANITNLVVGKKYRIAYNIVSTKANYKVLGQGNEVIDYSNEFCNKVSFRVKQNGQVVSLHEHMFLSPSDQQFDHGVWRSDVFEFTAIATTAEFELEPFDYGFIGLDLGANALTPCQAGITAVPLQKTSHEILCPETSVNLATFFGGLKPSGVDLVFFNNPTHTGIPLSNLNVGAGTYYAFYHDPVNNCYNQDVSTAKIAVTYRKCVDLTPTMTINGLNFPEGASRDFVVNLFEVNNRESAGNTSFRITKLGGFNITYPMQNSTSNVAGGTQNQNGNWTFTETANFITATSSVPIPANGKAVIGFKIQRKPGIPKGVTQNITPTILTGAGGDSNAKNNNSVTSVSTN